MHYCWAVDDVLRKIISSAFEDEKDGLKTVAALAITCRAFQSPALDRLWYTLPALAWLVQCLPSDAWKVDRKRGLTLRRPTVPSEWARCEFYTRRIRRFGYGLHDDSYQGAGSYLRVDDTILKMMESYQIIRFPNLRKVNWEMSQNKVLPHGLFLVPTLDELRFDCSVYEPIPLLHILQLLPESCPGLRSLSISSTQPILPDLPELSTTFVVLLQRLPRLQHLSCTEIVLPDEALRCLTVSSSLQVLHLKNNINDIIRCIPNDQPSFCHLRQISFSATNLQGCSQFLDHIDSGSLQSIAVVHTSGVPRDEELLAFFEALQNRCSHTKFTSIDIQCYRLDALQPQLWESSEHIIKFSTIKPLMNFHNLETIRVALECTVDIGDADVEVLTSAWPRLRQWQIGHADGIWMHPPKLTLSGLIPFAKHCPNLDSLCISINAITDNNFPIQRPGGGASCNLAHIELCDSLLLHPYPVAAFLSDIFPNLRSIGLSSTGEDIEWMEQWDKVEDVLPMLSSIRQQERAWKQLPSTI